MNTIKNPTDIQLQRLMNLIALRAALKEEGIYDSFSCYGWAIFTKDYCEWMEKNYPDLYDKVKTDSDITPIECQFWWKKDGEAGSAGYEAFKKNVEFIYANDYALKAVCKELKEFYDDFDEYKKESEWDEMEEEDGYSPWENDFVPFDSEDDYKSALTQFFKDVHFSGSTGSTDDEDFDFDAALADKDEEDDDMIFDPVLGPVSKKAKKLLGDLAASGTQIHGVAPGGGISGRLNIDKDGNITLPKNNNIESKNAASDTFNKQKNWKDIPDFDPDAAAEKMRKEEDDSDSGIDREQLTKEWREMLGDDFDFTRDVD